MIGWLALSMVLGIVAYLAAWSRLPTRARGWTIWAFAAALPLSGGLILSERGWPVELVPYLVTIPDGDHNLLGVKMIPEVSISVWLDINGTPRAFDLPWSSEQASKLQRMMEGGEGDLKARKKKGRTDEDFPMEFHAQPQPAAPEKQPEDPGFQFQGVPS
jgi:hypothetical protein